MEKVVILRYCEIHLKGKNRGYFENLLFNNTLRAMKGVDVKLTRMQARYILSDFDEGDLDEILNRVKKICGVHSFSVAYEVDSDLDKITEVALMLTKYKRGSFKVETKRADKKFPLNSMEISMELGGRILDSNQNLVVDIHNPQYTVNVDVREHGKTLVFSGIEYGVGGLPVGSSSKAMLLISGGIDSPVAGYMMAKRGMKLCGIHFHSYPYTSEAAKEKVVKLSKIVSEYSQGMELFVVPFTEIQEEIHKKCPADYMITIMRRFMMRIAERLAIRNNCKALITGESLGQVASQTVESITSSNSVIEKLPMFRPLIGFDKLEIIEISQKINTFETSILPYEDCCTVFLPKYPVIKPKLESVIDIEKALDVETLIANAMANIEKIEV